MDRLNRDSASARRSATGLGSLLVLVCGLALGLRLLHLAIPSLLPEVLPGPFHPERTDEVAALTGWEPWLPFYRPESLGGRPLLITIDRRPSPRVVMRWRGSHWLELEEHIRGAADPPIDGEPLDTPFPAWIWSANGHLRARALPTPLRGRANEPLRALELSTDLPRRDLERLIRSLRPADQLR